MRAKLLGNVIPGMMLLALLLPSLFFSSCESDADQAKVEKILEDSVFTERAEGVEIRFSDSGYLKAVLRAPVMERFPGKMPYTIFHEGIDGDFYDREGNINNNVKSGYAISRDVEKTVELRNDVRLHNVKNEKLNTEKLIWDQKTKKIYTDQFVKITTPENIIWGTGMEADESFTEYRIFNVSGEMSVKDAKNP